MNENVRIIEISDHFLSICDKIRGKIPAVKLHSFHDFQFRFSGFSFFHGNDAFIAHFFHSISDHFTDFSSTIGGNCSHLCNFCRSLNFFSFFEEVCHHFFNSSINSTLQIHWVHTSSNGFNTFLHNSLSQNSCCCCSITGNIIGFRSNFAQHLRTHIFELIFQFDFFCNGYTIFCDARRTE